MPPPPPRPSGGGARGPEGPPPPPPPTQAQERKEADRRNGGPTPPPKRPLRPGSGGTTAEAGAYTPCLLPADGGPATPRTAKTERPYQRPARGRRGREPGRESSPPPLPPPRRTDPSAADRTAPHARGRPATPTAGVRGSATAQHNPHTEHYSKLPVYSTSVLYIPLFWYTCPLILFCL